MLSPELVAALVAYTDLAVLAVTIGMGLFVVLYSVFYRWKKRRAGRAQWFLLVSFFLVMVIAYAARWIGENFWLRPLWQALVWSFAVWAIGYLIYALLRNWNKPEASEPIPLRTGPVPKQGSADDLG